MSLADVLGTTAKDIQEASGEVAKEFEVLASGAYKGTVEKVLVYTNNFKSKSMRYQVKLTDSDRIISYANDINSELQGNKPNPGYANRIKQFLYATNTSEADLGSVESKEKVKSYGKEYDAHEITGLIGKPITVLVLKRNNTNKEEGEPYKYDNVIYGVLAPNGTDSTGENKEQEFLEKIEITPVKNYKGYVKAETGGSSKPEQSAADKKETEAAGF
jgi:hypothetical protein